MTLFWRRAPWNRLAIAVPVLLIGGSVIASREVLARLTLVSGTRPLLGVIFFVTAVPLAFILPLGGSIALLAALVLQDHRAAALVPLGKTAGLVLLNAAAASLVTRSRWAG